MMLFWFAAGAVLGGVVTALVMASFQLHRINDYEAELRRLRGK